MELTIEQALQQGVAAHKEGRIQDAERLYRAILQVQPAHPDANHNLGVLAVTGNQIEAALPLFKIARDANPNVEKYWLNYIDALLRNNQIKYAKQEIKKAKKKGFDVKKLQRLRSQSESPSNNKIPSQKLLSSLLEQYQTGQHGDAEKLAYSITQDFPHHQFAWKVLGAIFGQSGRTVEAESANQRSVALSPHDAEAHFNLGVTLKEMGRLVEALASYNQSIALNPDFAEAHHNLGATLKELGRLVEALESYNRAIALKPDYAPAHYNLGNTLKELDRLGDAEASYKQAIVLKPDYALAYHNLGNTLKELGRLEDAEENYNQAIGLKPDYAQAHFKLGVTLQELNRLQEALASYAQAIVFKPAFSEAHHNLGATLKELGRLVEALGSYKQAIALKPDYPQAHNNLGVTLQKQDRLEEALTSYERAVDLKPDFAEAHYNLGNIAKELDRLDEASASYKQAVTLKPDWSSAKHMLSALTGETTESAPREYVENLFDNYAANFESSLVEQLEYNIPRIIAEIILKDRKNRSLGSIMDLGCGTGLFGLEIQQYCAHLEGIDLSEKMLHEAKKKDIYNKLIQDDIINYLSVESLNFDYFVSTDVFIYVGELSDIFRLIKYRNKTGGKFVFSTEDYDGDGFFLEKSGRYSHSKKYVEGLCKKFGFDLRHFETQALRKDKSQYISGGLYILDF